VALGEGRELLPDRRVVGSPRLIAIHTPAQRHQATRSSFTQVMLFHRVGYQLSSLSGGYSFFSTMSFRI
jgi:hypothetical protein